MQDSNIDRSSQGLRDNLGQHLVERIRYAQQGTQERQPRAQNLDNTILDRLQGLNYKRPPGRLMDVLVGVARSTDGNTKPLDPIRLFNIFQCMPVINTRGIQIMTKLEVRHAQRYMQAAVTAFPHLEKTLKKN